MSNVVALAPPPRSDDLPDPLTPASADLRNFHFMPLEIARLRKSKAWLAAKRDPASAFFMLNLWTAAWHCLPAGSLEDDEDVLADLAMCSPEAWPAMRERAMRGWIRCKDGRLYHPVVAEKVIAALAAKKENIERTEKARVARLAKRREDAEKPDPAPEISVTEVVTDTVTEVVTEVVTDQSHCLSGSVTSSNRDGREIEQESKIQIASLSGAPDGIAPDAPPAMPGIRDVLWRDGIPILRNLTGKSDKACRSFLGRVLREARDDCHTVNAALHEAADLKPADLSSWLMARCGGRREDLGRSRGGGWAADLLLGRNRQAAPEYDIDGTVE